MSGISYSPIDLLIDTAAVGAVLTEALCKAGFYVAKTAGKAVYKAGCAMADTYAKKKEENSIQCACLERLLEEEKQYEAQISAGEIQIRKACEEIGAAGKDAAAGLEHFFAQADQTRRNTVNRYNKRLTALLEEEKRQSHGSASVSRTELEQLGGEIRMLLDVADSVLPDGETSVLRRMATRVLENKTNVSSAYASLFHVRMQCLERLTVHQMRMRELEAFRKNLLLRLDVLEERTHALASVPVSHNGRTYIDDPREYAPELFAGLAASIGNIRSRVTAEGLLTDECGILMRAVREAEQDFMTAAEFSMKKMYAAYAMNDNAERITRYLEENGFRYKGSANEGGREGAPLHIVFENGLTGEKLALVLGPESGKRFGLWVHQYGGNDDGREQQRVEETNRILGQCLGKKVQCMLPGTLSTDYEAGDLEAARRRNTMKEGGNL